MYCKLVLIAVFCAAVKGSEWLWNFKGLFHTKTTHLFLDAHGLQCYNCTDAVSCQSPNTVECDFPAAIQRYQSLFAATYNAPSDQSVGCITANISFMNAYSTPILSLGCGFAALNSTNAKPSTNTQSFQYDSCDEDLCNLFSTSEPTTPQPPNSISCYTCSGEPCGNDIKVQCSDQEVANTFNSLSPSYGNFPATSGNHNFECLFLNTTVSNNETSGKYWLPF